MPKIVSVSLDKISQKIYDKINKQRNYGWFSKDVQEMLRQKYGTDKKQEVQELLRMQEQLKKLDEEVRAKAKKISKMKDES